MLVPTRLVVVKLQDKVATVTLSFLQASRGLAKTTLHRILFRRSNAFEQSIRLVLPAAPEVGNLG